jgi:hypothetical protein
MRESKFFTPSTHTQRGPYDQRKHHQDSSNDHRIPGARDSSSAANRTHDASRSRVSGAICSAPWASRNPGGNARCSDRPGKSDIRATASNNSLSVCPERRERFSSESCVAGAASGGIDPLPSLIGLHEAGELTFDPPTARRPRASPWTEIIVSGGGAVYVPDALNWLALLISGRLASRVRIRHLVPSKIRAGQPKKFDAAFRNAVLAPLRYGTRVDLAQTSDGHSSIKAVDDQASNWVAFVRFHGTDLSTLKSGNQVHLTHLV